MAPSARCCQSDGRHAPRGQGSISTVRGDITAAIRTLRVAALATMILVIVLAPTLRRREI